MPPAGNTRPSAGSLSAPVGVAVSPQYIAPQLAKGRDDRTDIDRNLDRPPLRSVTAAPSSGRPRRTRRKDDGVPLRRILRLAPWPAAPAPARRASSRSCCPGGGRAPAAAGPPAGSAVAAAAAARPAPTARCLRVRAGSGWVTARGDRRRARSPYAGENLDRVVAALDQRGRRLVPGAGASRSPHTAVAVPARDRARVVRLLEPRWPPRRRPAGGRRRSRRGARGRSRRGRAAGQLAGHRPAAAACCSAPSSAARSSSGGTRTAS